MIVTIQEDADQNFHNLKLMKGMIVVISSHILYSTNFVSTLNITKIFEHVKIHSILLVSPKHVLVLFEQEKYFEIYDFYSGELVFVQNFELKIKFIPLGNSDLIHMLTWDNIMYIDLFVVLENSEIKIFLLNIEDGEVKRKERTTIQSPGIECIYAHKHIGNEMDTLLFSFKDDSLFFIGEEIKILKPVLDEKIPKLSFRNLDFLSIYPGPVYLLLGNGQYIYAIIEEEELSYSNLVKFGDKNKYDYGRFLSNAMIGCISKGVIDIYRINQKNHIYKGILQMTFDAHLKHIYLF